ncbi:MAG: DUF4493 domain-containing protein [Muribaculaceae bacterium]|nr:DUF4493 domain-containing protein [Muribaculaceae bacterium]
MKRYHIFLILSLLATLATGCKDETWNHDGPGKKYGTLSFKSIVCEISGEQNIGRTIDSDEFTVEVTDGTKIINRYTYSQLPDNLQLETGDYSVIVRTSEVQKAAWEAPYYEGTKVLTINEDATTEVEKVICRLANIKVSVSVAKDLRPLMASDCHVHVIANDEGELTFSLADIDANKAGYFQYTDASKTLIATLNGTVSGKPLTLQAVYTDLEPGQHRIIYYSLKPVNDPTTPDDPNKPGIDPEDPDNPGTDPEDPDKPGTDPEAPNNPGTDPEDPDKPGTDPENPDKPGTDPEDPTTGRIELSNGLYLDVTIKTVNLNMSYPGEYYDPITGIIRPGDDDPDYTPPTAQPEDPQRPPQDLTDDNAIPAEPVNPKPEDPEPPVVDPDPEEPEEPTPPQAQITFSASQLKFDTPNKFSTDLDGKVFIHADAGIARLILNISSTDDDFAMIGAGLSGLDFAKPDDAKELGETFHIAYGDQVKDKTDVTFDITEPMGLLESFHGTHNFEISVTDNQGNTKTVVLSIVTD